VRILLAEIRRREKRGLSVDAVLSTDEVLEIREVDLENFIVKNSQLIGSGLRLVGRQVDTPEGRMDLLFEDKDKTLFVVELKLGDIGRGALNQLRRYIRHFRKSARKVRGAIVCTDVLPAFVDEFKKLRGIKILCYGWKLTVNVRRWD
jgi:RecB family endonuclease NucS